MEESNWTVACAEDSKCNEDKLYFEEWKMIREWKDREKPIPISPRHLYNLMAYRPSGNSIVIY
jgi:hypothetical protein